MTQEQAAEGSSLVATFLLDDALFGIEAHRVQEVVKTGNITQVYHAPPYVVGIRNLRGRIVTILDLKIKLDMGMVTPDAVSRILIVDGNGETIGLLVDGVADTLSVNSWEIMPAPPNLHGVQQQNLRGVYRDAKRVVGLLDLDKIVAADERAQSLSGSEESVL